MIQTSVSCEVEVDQFRLLLQDLENSNALSNQLQLKRRASSTYFSNRTCFLWRWTNFEASGIMNH